MATEQPGPVCVPASGVFRRELIKQLRAQDTFGRWSGKNDEELLAPYVLSVERRRELPLMADPDVLTVWRLEMFYNAVSLCIESATGIMVTPVVKLHAEGFGRLVLLAGRLAAVSKTLREVHRFGFSSLHALDEAGEKIIAEAIQMIERFPLVAEL
ncbi:NifX-associated nitrogen fixation protein [Paludibacterium yongneupense]|uniref:NifX-associated nitrogen fixation protein n=1 Tax=Paludibacterium yongneupense TaxID=400061 RepID=UPI0003FB2D7B|nr:NifX-associated nitrogen fixation protein [Paludibacterium yongneupense]